LDGGKTGFKKTKNYPTAWMEVPIGEEFDCLPKWGLALFKNSTAHPKAYIKMEYCCIMYDMLQLY
jgi:hypothetical protein